MGGIADALAGGNIQAAARVLWAGIHVAWLAGTEQIRAVWREVTTNLVKFGVDFAAGTMSVLATLWSAIESGFAAAFNGVVSAWKGTQNLLAGGMARVIARMSGQDVNEVLATLNEMQEAETRASESAIEAGNKARADAAKKRLDEIEEQRLLMLESVDEEASARAALADQALANAREELIAARTAAADLKPAEKAGAGANEKASLSAATSLGTFSTAALGRQSIGGFGKLEKAMDTVADNTKDTVAAISSLQMNWA